MQGNVGGLAHHIAGEDPEVRGWELLGVVGKKAFGHHLQLDGRLSNRALAEKQVDLIAGNSTDGLIARYGLVQLEDDRKYFPPYDAVPVARRAMLEQQPRVRAALKRLAGILTVDEMRRLNFALDGEKRQPKDVARKFLIQKGVLTNEAPGR